MVLGRNRDLALFEVDLVEHNSGILPRPLCCTLDVVDVVSSFSRRRAVLQATVKAGVSQANGRFSLLRADAPLRALHCDNEATFSMALCCSFFIRNRAFISPDPVPIGRTITPSVEQKKLDCVREIVGYGTLWCHRSSQDWLNQCLFLPSSLC